MSLTETTLLALVLSLILLFRGPERGLWALMISLPFGVAAAVNLPALGNSSLLMADLVALTLVALTVSRLLIAQESMTLRLPAFAWWLIARWHHGVLRLRLGSSNTIIDVAVVFGVVCGEGLVLESFGELECA